MGELWQAAITMPTVVFSVLLALVVLYWGFVALGAFDIDLLHVHADAGVDAGVDGHVDAGHAPGLLEFFSLGRVPLTVVLTVFVLGCWLLSLAIAMLARMPLALLPAPLAVLVTFLVAVVGGLLLTAWGARRLQPLFPQLDDGAFSRDRVIGRPVVITSVHADERFGTATADLDGTELLLRVVTRPGLRLAKGDAAVVLSYDEEREVHMVGALPHAVAPVAAAGDIPPAGLPPLAADPPPPLRAGPDTAGGASCSRPTVTD